MNDKTINIRGNLISLRPPLVMGILNVTPDSFYAGSRRQTEADIHNRITSILEEGGRIIDIGGYSSRPSACEVPEEEEMQRVALALQILNRHYPGAIASVDTFRSGVARRSVEVYGAAVINDISGGELDAGMFETIAALQVPYILMHMRGTPQTMQQYVTYDNLLVDVRKYLADKIYKLELLGVNDIIIDPGFGFSKTTEQNFELMRHLDEFAIFGLPLLVGVSRKSMIYKTLGISPGDSLNGSAVMHTLALLKGADILRVHDVREAVEAVRLIEQYSKSDSLCGCTSE
ncbi:MAG: dihydropteroate synthase [Tannerellaceae bacterium]|nr:dihydropteroate synthase [Tannerellaceae bacterium]